MTSTFRLLTCAATLLLQAAPVLAQPPADLSPTPACRVEAPRIPVVDWSGQAAYRARATVKNAHAVAVEITALTRGVDRRSQRSLVMAIEQALRKADCDPGDHVFEKTFTFDIAPRSAAPAASAAG